MRRIKKKLINLFLIVLGIVFLWSCAAVDKQTEKEIKEPPPAPAVSEEAKPQPKKEVPHEEKERPKKAPAVRHKHPEHKPVPKESEAKTAPEAESLVKQQKKHYNDGLRYYTQAKYHEAKAAWQEVIKLGPKTHLAAKARNYIMKADAKLKYLEKMK